MCHSCVFATTRAYIKTPVTAKGCFDIMKGLRLSAEKLVVWKKVSGGIEGYNPLLTLSLWTNHAGQGGKSASGRRRDDCPGREKPLLNKKECHYDLSGLHQ